MDRVKFAKLCELLRSDNSHERALAAQKATEFLQAAGRSWSDLILSETAKTTSDNRPSPQPPNSDIPRTERLRILDGNDAELLIGKIFSARQKLSGWEERFIACLRLQGPSKGLTRQQWLSVKIIAERHNLWINKKKHKKRRKPHAANLNLTLNESTTIYPLDLKE